MLTLQDKLTIWLIAKFRIKNDSFVKCRRNDFLLLMLRMFGTNPERFKKKVDSLRTEQ